MAQDVWKKQGVVVQRAGQEMVTEARKGNERQANKAIAEGSRRMGLSFTRLPTRPKNLAVGLWPRKAMSTFCL